MSTFVIVPLSSNLLKLSTLIKDVDGIEVEVTASTAKATSVVIGEDIILFDRLEIFQNSIIPAGKYTFAPSSEGQYTLKAIEEVKPTTTKVNTTRSCSTNSKAANQ